MKRAISIGSLLLLPAFVLSTQEPTTLRVDVKLVNVVATVTDSDGNHVSGLRAEDFTITEDGALQKISHFTQDRDIPVSVGILLDTSGSMAVKIRTATQAVDRFINKIHEDDDIFLMTFSRSIDIRQAFTSDRKKLSRALGGIQVSGGTVLYEALSEGLTTVAQGKHDKRALLVISDGIDAGSRRATLDVVLRDIRKSEVLVYGLGTAQTTYADPVNHVPFTLPTPASAARGPLVISNPRPAPQRGSTRILTNGVDMSVMNQFSDNSGGRAFLLSDTFIDDGTSEIDKILTSIADEMRGQYTLGYYPSAPDDGRFHAITVKTRAGLTIRTRTGYQGR